MKKIKYILGVFLVVTILSFTNKALANTLDENTSSEEIFNSISKEGKITVNSLFLESYKNSKYYGICLERQTGPETQEEKEKICIESILTDIVSAHIKKNTNIPKQIWVYASSCDSVNKTCNIYTGIDMKTFNIELIETKDEKIYNEVETHFKSMSGSYSLYDMGYINQLINYGDISGFFDEMQNSSKVLSIYPELKKELEKTKDIEYVSIFGGGGGPPTNYGAGGTVVAFKDGVAVGITEISYITYKTIFIDNKTPNTPEEYIKAALDRINKYINNEDYKVEIVYDKESTNNFCTTEWEECVLKNVFTEGDRYSFELYKIIINGKENFLGIVPVDAKNIKTLEIESTNHETGINVETNSSDVPLDTNVLVEDVTEEHKKDGFIKAYDINLFSHIKGVYIKKVKDGILVRIPIDDNYKKDFVFIRHIDDNGEKKEQYKAEIEIINGKKYAVFTANHFSTYAIENDNGDVPNTFDGVCYSIMIILITSICLFISFLTLKRNLRAN